MLSIADDSINKMRQLFAASICHGEPGLLFFSTVGVLIYDTWNKSCSTKFAERVTNSFSY